ncbi:MAG: hypothetical protein ACXWCY_07485 [Burkholderiales bacterium]
MPERREGDQHHGLHVKTVLAALGGLMLVVVLVALAVHAFATWRDTPLAGPNAPMDAQIAGPKLQSAPQFERAEFVAEKQHLLESYGWIDPKRGVARIPIEVAMQMLVQRHETKANAIPAFPLEGKERAEPAAGQQGEVQ